MSALPFIFWINIIFNNNMTQISDIYIIIIVSLLHLICIFRGRKNSQHYMLANIYYNKISIDN